MTLFTFYIPNPLSNLSSQVRKIYGILNLETNCSFTKICFTIIKNLSLESIWWNNYHASKNWPQKKLTHSHLYVRTLELSNQCANSVNLNVSPPNTSVSIATTYHTKDKPISDNSSKIPDLVTEIQKILLLVKKTWPSTTNLTTH